MDFDFNLILVPVTLILGVIWVFDKLFLKKHSVFVQHQKTVKQLEQSLAEKNKSYEQLKQAFIDKLKSSTNLQNFTTDLTNDDTIVQLQPTDLAQYFDNETQAFHFITQQLSDLKNLYREKQNIKNELDIKIKDNEKYKEPFYINWAYDFFPIIAVVLVVRSFIVEPFNIPSSSMVPTLYTGDFIAVNKYAYGIRLPLLNKKIINVNDPQHGDVVVFRYPLNPKIYYIKRVIGVGGDTVSFNNGVLSVNGKVIQTQPVSFVADKTLTEQLYPAGQQYSAEQAKQQGVAEETQASYTKETPSATHEHLVRHLGDKVWYQYAEFLQQADPNLMQKQGQQWQITVPQGQYFVMGDNRDRSADSRFWGFVPDENVAGKAVYVWMHKESGLNMPNFNRNGAIH